MKIDDPKLTAFALGELFGGDIETVDQRQRSNEEIAAEIRETRDIAAILRESLQHEPAGELAPHQRDAIFRAARISQTTVRPEEKPASVIFDNPRWWNRPGPWQGVAACAITAFAVFALSTNPSRMASNQRALSGGELVMPVPTDVGTSIAGVADPELATPQERGMAAAVPSPKVNSPRLAAPNPALRSVQPAVKIDENKTFVASPPVPQGEANGGSASRETRPSRGPKVIGNGEPLVIDRLAAASVARADQKPGTVTDEAVSLYLKARSREVGEMQPGKTFDEFSRVFRAIPGVAGRYEMIRNPAIEVDAKFTSPDGRPLATPPTPESRLQEISKPYLE